MKVMITIWLLIAALNVGAQQTFRVGGEIMNTDTFELRVYAHPIGLIDSKCSSDKIWNLMLGQHDIYIIEFEADRVFKVLTLIGFQGRTHDLIMDVNFNNKTNCTAIMRGNKVELIYTGRQLFIKRF